MSEDDDLRDLFKNSGVLKSTPESLEDFSQRARDLFGEIESSGEW
jgi:hypothetical protein